jgi:hypothetical protein
MPLRTIGTLALVEFQGAITSTQPLEFKLWRLHRLTTFGCLRFDGLGLHRRVHVLYYTPTPEESNVTKRLLQDLIS